MSVNSSLPEAEAGHSDAARETPLVADVKSADITWTERAMQFVWRTSLIFALYALSIGPLYWQWYGARFGGGPTWIAVFYEPLIILSEAITPFGDWMNWYVNLWIA